MRAPALLAFVACGCSRVYDIGEARLHDARGLDAPFACPAFGARLQLAPGLHQLFSQALSQYTPSPSGRAVAMCSSGLCEGSADGPLDPIQLPVLPGPIEHGRLTPDGQSMLLLEAADAVGIGHLLLADRSSGFTRLTSIGYTVNGGVQLGTIASGPSGYRTVIVDPEARTLQEITSSDLVTWTNDGAAYMAKDLGLASLKTARYTSDGLRMVIVGSPYTQAAEMTLLYVDRPTTDARFAAAAAIDGAPVVQALADLDPVLLDDCSRVTLSAFDVEAVFYLQPQ